MRPERPSSGALYCLAFSLLVPLPALAQIEMSASGQPVATATPGYLEWYEGLRELAPDPARGASIEGVTIVRDVGTFELHGGVLHALADVGGRTVGAAFRGTGTFRMTIPDPLEAERARKEFGDRFEARAIEAELEGVVFLFTDFTLSELEQQGIALAPAEPSGAMKGDVREAREYFTNGDDLVSRDVLLPLINAGPGFFYAHVEVDGGDPLFFRIDPMTAEEVSVSVRTDRGKSRRTVAAFHRAADYQTGRSLPQEALDLVAVTGADLDVEISGGLDMEVRATLSLERLMPTHDWIPFHLFSEFEVDSMIWGDGTPARFHRPEDSSSLWVDFGGMPDGVRDLTFV